MLPKVIKQNGAHALFGKTKGNIINTLSDMPHSMVPVDIPGNNFVYFQKLNVSFGLVILA